MTSRILLLAALLALAAAPAALAQTSRNAVYFELGGSAVIPSLNYERRVTDVWFGRAGASVVTSESSAGDDDTTYVVPLTASYVRSPGASHHLELGGGVTFSFGDRQDLFDNDDGEQFSTAVLTGIVGYRYQKPDGGFQFRAVFTPVAGAGDLEPWAGVSFGYAW